jgi:hypothetical protein
MEKLCAGWGCWSFAFLAGCFLPSVSPTSQQDFLFTEFMLAAFSL